MTPQVSHGEIRGLSLTPAKSFQVSLLLWHLRGAILYQEGRLRHASQEAYPPNQPWLRGWMAFLQHLNP